MVVSREGFFSAVVCDGMGGAKGGNIASSLAVKAYTQVIKATMSKVSPDSLTEKEIERIIKQAIEKANTVVYEAANYDIELEGMGTTLVSVLIYGDNAVVANVGDSRLYIYKEGNLKQITNDHSFVQYLIDKGSLTKEEAKNHPNRNIILKALGVNESVEPDIFNINNEDYDMLLLCSDGLTTHIPDEEILEVITRNTNKKPSYKKKTEILIEKANNKGGVDNITAVLIGKEN